MSGKTIKIIQNYAKKLKKSGVPIKSIYIFGSAAKGNIRRDSDIDTCVVSPIFGKDRQRERVRLMNLREGISDLIEPHPISVYEFNNLIDPFINEIKQSGIKVI